MRTIIKIIGLDWRMRGEVNMGKITGICISEKRGVQKHLITEANIVCDWGIEGDAHGGKWHRQISLLSKEKVDAFKAKGADIHPGSFGENLIVEGVDFSSMPVGTRFVIGDVVLEMTQIGKECHNHCLIYKTMGDCIMPREGVFAEVITGWHIKIGQEVTCISPKADRPYISKGINGLNQLAGLQKGTEFKAPDALDYTVGDRVRHIKYGEGTVLNVAREPRDYKVTVEFDQAGQKIMYASFAKLKQV